MIRSARTVGVVLALLVCAAAAHAFVPHGDPFRVEERAIALDVTPGGRFETSIAVRGPADYFLYEDKLDLEFVTLEGLHIDAVRFPKATTKRDPETGRERSVFSGGAVLTVEGSAPPGLATGTRELIARLSFQGCSAVQCYRPRTEEVRLTLDVMPAEELKAGAAKPAAAGKARKAGGIGALLRVQDFGRILERGILWTVGLVFLAGLLSSLTPCVWPIVPVILVVIGVERQRSVARNLLLALSLVAGLVIVYALLGVVAGALGRNLGFIFQQRWFLFLIVLFFVAMSLSLFGVFEVHLSSAWAQRLHRLGGSGYRGAFLSGLGLGLIASPCTGPVIAALVGYVALQGSYLKGFLLFVVYGLGMGVLIVIIGAAYGELAHKLKGGAWMVWIKRALGVVLLIPAAFYMGSLLHFDVGAPQTTKPTVEWVDRLEDGLKFARRERRPIMMDFYADWCPPCRKLDRTVFTREDIVKLSYRLIPVRVDATRDTPRVRRLMDEYQVMGLPTIVFLAPDGAPYGDLRVTVPTRSRIERAMREAIARAMGLSGKGADDDFEYNGDEPDDEGDE